MKLFYDIMVAVFLVYKIICAAYTTVVVDKFQVRLYVFSIMMYFFSALFLILFFAASGKRFMLIVEQVDSLTERLLRSGLGHEDLLISHYQTAVYRISRFASMMAVVSVLCPSFFCVSAPVIDLLHGKYRSRTAVPGQCPIEFFIQKIPGFFELIVLLQAYAFFIPCTTRYITECLMLGFFKIQSTYFLYLSATLRDIGQNMTNNKNSNEQFLRWIKLHQDVIKTGYELSSFFSPVIVLYYFSTIIAVAGPLLYILDTKSVNIFQSVFGGMAMLTALCQLYLQCHVANEISTEGEKVGFGAYSMPWTAFGRAERGLVRQIITMCNQPIYVEGYRCPAFRLDRVSYQALFLNTVSTFMAFRKIQEMNDLQHNLTE